MTQGRWARQGSQKSHAGGPTVTWTQVYDPLGHWWLSTLVAALPILVLLGLLAGLRVRAHLCAIAGASTAVIVAILAFKMPALLAVSSFFFGSAFGLLKIVWIVIAAVFLYDISVVTGQFEIMKQSVAAITPDRRLQLSARRPASQLSRSLLALDKLCHVH